jgi:hypothetical protein
MTKYEITTFEQYNPFSRVADRGILVIGSEHVRNHLAHLPVEAQEEILEEAEGNGTRFTGKDGKMCHIRALIDYSKVVEPTAAQEDREFEARQMAAEDAEDLRELRGFSDWD